MKTLFLRKPVMHPHHGVGYFTFEEDAGAKLHRTLQATFQDGKTITGCVVVMAGLGVKWTDGAMLDLPDEPTQLNGHHGAKGPGIDIKATLARLSEVAEQRRATAA
jgi:hypothetical protein